MASSAIKASVVVPTRGRSGPLLSLLSSLGGQDLQGFEVIVVDDGSPAPLELPASDSFPLRLVRQENAGPAAARNRGAREARGEILAFTDDDCLPRPGWLAALTAEIESHSNALVGSLTFNGLRENPWSTTSQLVIDLVYDHFNRDPENAYFLTSNNLACRREVFMELGGFDPEFSKAGGEDRDFCDRWRMTKRPIRLVRQPLVEHRHAQNLMKFLDLHFRYGRGAYLYQAKRKQRASGTMAEDFGFHCSLVRELPLHLNGVSVRRKISTFLGLGLWQAANAVGFFNAHVTASRANPA